MKKCVISLSGGLDSTTNMAIAHNLGQEIYPITFSYGQRHSQELECAKKVAAHYGVEHRHKIVDVEFLHSIGGSSLTDLNMEVPESMDTSKIPTTYVPHRNLIFTSLAAAYGEVIGAKYIYLGVNTLDYSGYPDCRPEFIDSLQQTINLSSKNFVETGEEIKIATPLLHMTKAEIITKGMELNAPYHLSISCYKGTNCGVCDSCRLRLKGFAEAGYTDPITYE
ncbi:7-cyano-7-deazaguanine synthase [Desulfitispora alkaliphila]|uniref:7-cyano-7-deazaguanine synthase QueC n=1 Tax=Desulfitispora alkaliphila TaxID=622674 RepID=UPI003D1A4915